MLRRRRKLTTALASLALGTAPLGLFAQDTYYAPSGQVCPPSFQTPLPQYGPYGTCPPGSMPSQPTPYNMPPTPSQPSTPSQSPSTPTPADQQPTTPQTPDQSQDSNQPSTPDQQPTQPDQQQEPQQQQQQPQQQQQQQQPQMATPTFNPSVGSQATSAATSPQATAPNMIGDLFGTGGGNTVYVSQFFGNAVYHLPPGGINDFHLIELPAIPTDPALLTSIGSTSYFLPTVSPPAPLFQDNLTNQSGEGHFTASQTPMLVEVEGVPNQPVYVINELIPVEFPSLGAAPGANVGRQKLAENTSPVPQDRVFVNYSQFTDTSLSRGGEDVSRITPGFEKTFFDGLMSVELRAPFASTLTSDINTGSMGSDKETELGNLTVYWKTLLWQDATKSISAGLGVAIPTADDVSVNMADGSHYLEVENRAAHVLPFVGGVWFPEPRLFVQGICQFDVDTSGNPVQLADYQVGQPNGRMRDAGSPDDADFVFVDFAAGYWMYENHCSDGFLKGFAPIVEVHYNRVIDRPDTVPLMVNGGNVLVASNQKTDLFNGLVGATAALKHNASLTVAYTLPIGNNDKQFDNEVRVIFNWLFGGNSNRGAGTNFRGLALSR